jgi:hypothetical protein
MSRVPVVIALLLIASPALAFDTSRLGQGGTLPLDDLMPLIKKTPALQREIIAALVRIGKKDSEVICSGMRFPGQWVNLGGLRVSPYACQFGRRWLSIKADVRITDKAGRVYETITPQAMKNAATVTESKLSWTWSNKMP